jgi:hypothetical protein
MKQRFLFLTALFMAVLNVSSAFADSWVMPTPAASALKPGSKYYVYNVGTKKFISKGEAWGTQAIVDSLGMEAKLDTLSNGIYSIAFTSTGKMVFRTNSDTKIGSGIAACFTDGNIGKGANHVYWSIKNIGNNLYTIQVPAIYTSDYVAGKCLGVQPNHTSSAATPTYGTYYDVDSTTYASGCQWQFVSSADYNTYFTSVQVYAEAQLLSREITKAQTDGLDITKAQAVYNNTLSTIDEMKAAIAELYQQRANQASVSNPSDMTGRITNPTFDKDITGWTSTMNAKSNKIATNQAGDFTVPFFENWTTEGSSLEGKMYQKIGGLQNGVYRLKAAVSAQNTKTAMADGGVYLFGNDMRIGANTVTPAYKEVFVPLTTDTLEIGLMQNATSTNNWLGLDNVTLTYYGKALEAYQYMTSSITDTWQTEFTDVVYKQSLYDVIPNLISAASTTTNAEDAITAYKNVNTAIESLRANIIAYTQFINKITAAENLYYSGYTTEELYDAYTKAQELYDAQSLTTEEISSEIVKLDSLMDVAKHQLIAGNDCTPLIVNNDFSQTDKNTTYTGFAGWTVKLLTGNNSNPNIASNVAEVWNNDFDCNQSMKNMPNGVYKVDLQAYYRTGDGAAAYGYYTNKSAEDSIKAYIYANGNEQKIKNVFDDRQTTKPNGGSSFTDSGNGYTPNDKASAAAYFGLNLYNNSVYGIVTDSTLNIGIKCIGMLSHGWTLWNDFKLTYEGFDATVLKKVLNNSIINADTLVDHKMNEKIKSSLQTEISNANTAVSGTDGLIMMKAYKSLISVFTTALTSSKYYNSLDSITSVLKENIDIYKDDAKESAVTTATALSIEATTVLNDGSYDNSQIIAKITAIKLAIRALQFPKDDATDATPQNYTFLITNPSFANNTAEGWTGTAGHNINNNCIEGWNGNFDIYQTITNVPNGTYKLTAQGFYRMGDATYASNAYRYDSTRVMGSLYANNDQSQMESVMNELTKKTLNGYFATYIPDSTTMTTILFPGSQQAASSCFTEGMYMGNSVVTKVTNGTLTIGFRNKSFITNDWTVATNFQLMYYGTDSALIPTDITGISENNEVQTRKFFSIDGRESDHAGKGINIVKTIMKDGSVKTTKILIK